jgi:pyruvyl transferase EpsO
MNSFAPSCRPGQAVTGAAMQAGIRAHMETLSRQLDICAPLLTGKLVLLDYPVHENVGDQLIWHGEQAFLKRHGKLVLGQFSSNNVGRHASALLAECTTICLHGGGNFGDLWPAHQVLREGIIQQFPHKRIVMLPQSVHFDDPVALDRACQIIRRHPDLHILLRDRRSLSLLSERGVPNLMLCPDMAHALWGTLAAPGPSCSLPLYLLRRDKEAVARPPDIAAQAGRSVDWPDLLTGWTSVAFGAGIRVDQRDGFRPLNNRLPAHSIWSVVSKRLIGRAIDLLAPHRTIVTDRLHAVILATLLGRRSVALDNCYGKTSSYVSLWMQDLPSIELRGPGLSERSGSEAANARRVNEHASDRPRVFSETYVGGLQ